MITLIAVIDYLAFAVLHPLDLHSEVLRLEGVAHAHLGVHRRVEPRDAPRGSVQHVEGVRDSALQRARNLL